jgi:hypothetical protein
MSLAPKHLGGRVSSTGEGGVQLNIPQAAFGITNAYTSIGKK